MVGVGVRIRVWVCLLWRTRQRRLQRCQTTCVKRRQSADRGLGQVKDLLLMGILLLLEERILIRGDRRVGVLPGSLESVVRWLQLRAGRLVVLLWPEVMLRLWR